jgi:hypothetical protein
MNDYRIQYSWQHAPAKSNDLSFSKRHVDTDDALYDHYNEDLIQEYTDGYDSNGQRIGYTQSWSRTDFTPRSIAEVTYAEDDYACIFPIVEIRKETFGEAITNFLSRPEEKEEDEEKRKEYDLSIHSAFYSLPVEIPSRQETFVPCFWSEEEILSQAMDGIERSTETAPTEGPIVQSFFSQENQEEVFQPLTQEEEVSSERTWQDIVNELSAEEYDAFQTIYTTINNSSTSRWDIYDNILDPLFTNDVGQVHGNGDTSAEAEPEAEAEEEDPLAGMPELEEVRPLSVGMKICVHLIYTYTIVATDGTPVHSIQCSDTMEAFWFKVLPHGKAGRPLIKSYVILEDDPEVTPEASPSSIE